MEVLGSDLRVLLVLTKRCSPNVNVTTTMTTQKLLPLLHLFEKAVTIT